MTDKKFIERAAEILLRAGKKQKNKLPDARKEAANLSNQIEQVKKSKQLNQIFEDNAQEILRRVKKSE